jgi:hypothetical protein
MNKWSCTSTLAFSFALHLETNVPLALLRIVKFFSDDISVQKLQNKYILVGTMDSKVFFVDICVERIQPDDTLVLCTRREIYLFIYN